MNKKSDMQSGMRVAFYVRVSTDEQVERYGVDLQIDSLKGLIKSRGKLSDGSDAFIFAGDKYLYRDDGVSGTVDLDERPAFARLKEDIVNAPEGNKPFDMVAVFKIDRFARKLKILLDVIEFFEENEIKFMSANESIDTSTPFGKAILGIIGVIAELELENIKLRTQAGREQAAKVGKAMGASAPYGYEKDKGGRLIILEPEAEMVRTIFTMFVEEKHSTQEIANWLKEHKVFSPAASAVYYGKRKKTQKRKNANEFWRSERVSDILKDERYIGNNYYNRYGKGSELPKSEWKLSDYRVPAIVNPLTFKKAQKLLVAQKHTRAVAKDDHIYLLSGLLKCGSCFDRQRDESEWHWSGWRKELHKGKKDFVHSYICGRKNRSKSSIFCNALPLPAEEIENFILEESIKFLRDPRAVHAYQQKLLSTRKEITSLRKKQKYLTDLLNAIPRRQELMRQQHQGGVIDIERLKTDYEALKEDEKRLRKELDEVEKRIAQGDLSESYLKATEVFADTYRGVMDDLRTNRKGASQLLHSLIDEIIVDARPVQESDVIAGRKKPDQKIPHELYVRLKLPFEMINLNLWRNQRQQEGSRQNPLSGGRGEI